MNVMGGGVYKYTPLSSKGGMSERFFIHPSLSKVCDLYTYAEYGTHILAVPEAMRLCILTNTQHSLIVVVSLVVL
jgi:hypothetical protein